MVVTTESIAIWKDSSADDPALLREFGDVLQDFGRSRPTRHLIRQGKDRDIKFDLRVPLVREFYVRPREFGRRLRRAWRTALGTAVPGDCFLIDLVFEADSRLVVMVTQATDLPSTRAGMR